MSPSTNEALRALASRDRRRLLAALGERTEQGEALSVQEAVPAGRRDPEAFRAELHHRHLPRLEAAGLVEWDRDARRVSTGPQFEEIRAVLEHVTERPDDGSALE